MDLEQLDFLEQKINQAVKIIEDLKRENQDLKIRMKELNTESQLQQQELQQLKKENSSLLQQQDASSLTKEKEEIIKSKVEQMLSRLDEFQY